LIPATDSRSYVHRWVYRPAEGSPTLPHCGREGGPEPTSDTYGSTARDRSRPPAHRRSRSSARRLDRRHRREAPSRLSSPPIAGLPFDHLLESRRSSRHGPRLIHEQPPERACSLTAERTRRPALTRHAHDQPAQRERPKRVKCDEAFLARIRAGKSTHQALSARAFRGPRPRAARQPPRPRLRRAWHRTPG